MSEFSDLVDAEAAAIHAEVARVCPCFLCSMARTLASPPHTLTREDLLRGLALLDEPLP